MADTLIYIQDHNYDTRNQMQYELSTLRGQLEAEQRKYVALQADLAKINKQIRYTGQYYGNKKIYQEMIHSSNKALFRKQYPEEIHAFEDARQYLTQLYPDGSFPPMTDLKQRKQQLQYLVSEQKMVVQELGNQEKELQIACENVDAILDQQPVQEQKKTYEEELS